MGREAADGDGALGAVLALEATPRSATVLADYAAALRRLADTLDDPGGGPPLQTALTEWLVAELKLEPAADWGSWREARWDAAVDIVADGPRLAGFLRQVAAQVEARPPGRLHLLSMLRAKVVWRARDKMRRRSAREGRRGELPPGRAPAVDPQSRCVAGLVIARVAEEVSDAPAVRSALATMLAGGSVSDAARESGLSRQAIYRALARLRAFVEGGS